MRYGRKGSLSGKQKELRLKQYSVRGYKRWIDPFPSVHGTEPEKRVYAALSARNIRFYFLNDISISIPELELFKEYQADFILPDHKIIIEVQGAYWHSKPETQIADAFKLALYETQGYKPLAWWDFDIFADINQLFLAEPLLAHEQAGYSVGTTELAPIKRTKINTSTGIVTLNKKRAARNAYRKKPIRYGKTRPAGQSYSVGL